MQWQKLTIFGLFCGLLMLSRSILAQEAAEVRLRTTITGNQEQPKVLYIVPWRSVNDSELANQTIQSQMDMVFGHVEKVELQRELSYIKQLTENKEED